VPEFDAVVAGGGLSGLSLAAHLVAAGWGDRSVLVVDDPRARPSAVSWGFWSSGPGLLDGAVSRSYDQVRIQTAVRSRLLPLGGYRYRVVRRADLVTTARAIVDDAPGFRVVEGHVDQVCGDGDSARVTVDGRTLRCGWAFDSVTAPAAGLEADAWLAFAGWQIRCTRPVFDPATPVLFDFRVPQAGSSRFVYILPEAPDRALVELTAFVPRRLPPPGPAERRAALAGYLTGVLGCGNFRIERSEAAVLPLRTRPVRRVEGRVVAIGAAAGLVKASTGYAYERIQRDSARIAGSLVRHGHPFGAPPADRRYRLLDAVLLDVLDREPAQLELAFARLFEANPAERVLRFLDEGCGPTDLLRLMASLPPGPYVRALARRVPRGRMAGPVGRATCGWGRAFGPWAPTAGGREGGHREGRRS
jgi:lycopene beta-cyclase